MITGKGLMLEVRLSVLDLVPVVQGANSTEAIHHALTLAKFAEEAGFYRFWLGEHHGIGGLASSAPTVIAAWIAGNTSTLRIGAGGVLLQNSDALTVAEQFHTLEALFPGRIDVGIGRGQGMHESFANALAMTEWAPRPELFERRLHEFLSMLGGKLPLDMANNVDIPITPLVSATPQVWLLASSEAGAERAARLGLPLVFAHHLQATQTTRAVARYRELFPHTAGREPYVGLAVGIVVGEDDEHAQWLSRPHLVALARHSTTGRMQHFPHPDEVVETELDAPQRQFISNRLQGLIIGGPETVRRRLSELVSETAAQEIFAVTLIHDPDECIRSFSRLVALANLR
jgi:luciferase family oxidoreductase group 1